MPKEIKRGENAQITQDIEVVNFIAERLRHYDMERAELIEKKVKKDSKRPKNRLFRIKFKK